MNEMKLYKKAIETYGEKHQLLMVIEELGELQKELLKAIRYNDSLTGIEEELTDVEICLNYIKIIFPLSYCRMYKIKQEKLEKLKNNIDNIENV